MNYAVGNIVYLINDITVYITGYDEKTQKYIGFDINDDSSKEVKFSETSIVMQI